MTGTLPKDLGVKCVSLRQLHIDHNKFSGTVPYSYVNIGNGRLTALSIDHNRLTGIVPGANRNNYEQLVQYTMHNNFFASMETEICDNRLMVELKADCPNVGLCFGQFWNFCDRWCGFVNDDDDFAGNESVSQFE